MPTPQEILIGLTAIATETLPLAVAWHLVLAAALAALFFGWRPGRRFTALALAAPPASAAALAWMYGNPFNGAVLTAVALGLAMVGNRLPGTPAAPGPGWAQAAGALLVAFGWIYPHFLDAYPPLVYLIAAPTGLVPCPTLSVLIGLALLGDGFGSRPWSLLLAGAGVFYGAFGAFRLGVTIDLALLAGALALAVLALLPHGHPEAHITPRTV